MNKREVFKQLLDNFETDKMRTYCEEMIDTIPDYIFTMPSSTTGKHHNATQCQKHGQVFHIIMFGSVMNYLLALKCNKQKFPSPEQRDAMRCAPIFHDAIKCGTTGSQFTVHEHPMLAGAWVRETKVTHDIEAELKETIARMCERHSGEWTSSKRSKTVLPEPETEMEILCHECDILSSRSDIDMQPTEELLSALAAEAVDPAQVTIQEASPLDIKINDVINLCRTKIEKGVNRDTIYAEIEKIIGAKNPRKIPDVAKGEAVWQAINNIT